jgi:hypothetical protein
MQPAFGAFAPNIQRLTNLYPAPCWRRSVDSKLEKSMLPRHNIRLLVLALLVFSLQVCSAQAPSGTITIPVDPTVAPIWDLTGTLDVSQPVQSSGGEVLLGFAIPVTQDARGRLTGSGVIFLDVNGETVASDFTADGRVSGGGDSTKVTLTVKLTGEDVVAGGQTPFNITITYKLKVDPEGLVLVGTSRGNARFKSLGIRGNIKSDVSIPLPAGVDGSWAIQMDILALNNLGGTGSFALSNGRSLPANLTGSFSEKSNASKVKLTGFDEGLGSSVNLNFTTTEAGVEIQKLRGKVLGQTVKQ